MNHDSTPAYGLWTVAFINAAVFILFAFSFFKPRTRSDWKTFSSFSAFIVALFVEMYGFPLTIYLLSAWLANRFPGVDLLSHDAGHLWYALFGLKGDPHWNPIHVASSVLIGGGFVLLAGAWRVLYVAQSEGRLATTGPYRWLRHPQYAGFILIMLGFLVQWPTILTLAMFPVLVVVYVRLAHREERDVAAAFGEPWRAYAAITPRWFPRFGRHWTTPPAEVRP
jgi:protein-S-isoprenylcysteine O-methyltransferase Ste14